MVRKLLFRTILILILPVFLLANHSVGEPELEQSEVWRRCCEKDDCFPVPWQVIDVIGEQAIVRLETYSIVVTTEKIQPAPTDYHWICLVDRNGEFVDKNIRCLLHPKKLPFLT